MATETNTKKVTVDQLKKALARAKNNTDTAISNIESGETATDKEVEDMLNEVFGPAAE